MTIKTITLKAILCASLFITTPVFASGVIENPTINTYQLGDFVNYEDGTKYLDQKDGYLKNKFAYIKGKYYYFNEDGFAEPKIIKQNGELKLINGEKEDTITGWFNIEGSWRYVENGKAVTGWKEIATADGSNKYYYYFDENGAMLVDTYTPDGYKVNSDGVYTGEKKEDDYIENQIEIPQNVQTSIYGVSGYKIDNTPAELFMLSIAGETSGLRNPAVIGGGDKGRAYGMMQFDYRYDLTAFMNQAYQHNPNLWKGFELYRGYPKGTAILVGNSGIGNTFINAMNSNAAEAAAEQINFVKKRYWNSCKAKLDAAGFHLGTRHIAVSAAILSVNINCGDATKYYLAYLNPAMTDEQMIDKIYEIRNNILSQINVNGAIKGTTGRYLVSEPAMAKDMLYGRINLFSDRNYGNGVEWYGSQFTKYLA